LRSRQTPNGEFPELLLGPDGLPQAPFAKLSYASAAAPGGPLPIDAMMLDSLGDACLAKARRPGLYATGLERGSSNAGYAAVSTLFLREPKRLARAIAAA